jgi:hypothetical protein
MDALLLLYVIIAVWHAAKEYFRKREILLRNERILLQTISFDLTVEHPYRYLLSYVKALSGCASVNLILKLTACFC